MTENETKLRPNQIKSIEVMLSAGSIDEAAQAAGVQRSTVYRWLKEPAYSAALRTTETEALRLAAARFAGAVELALETLIDIMKNSESERNRISAAKGVTSALGNIQILGDIKQVIEDLKNGPNTQ